MKSTILVVDDEVVNQRILQKILSESYQVLLADNGLMALEILEQNENIAAIITDLIMPVMDGIEFLEKYSASEKLRSIPVIVSTSDSATATEVECLRLGAWDFIKKPYDANIIKFRVNNVIERSEVHALKELQYREQYDTLTGLYKKERFMKKTKALLEEHPDKTFAMICFDIYKFQTFNNVFGMKEGDKLLCYIADRMVERLTEIAPITYCHNEADVFNICLEYTGEERLKRIFAKAREELNAYKENYNLIPNFGVYIIEDRTQPVLQMIDNAKLAAKESKGNYIKNYAFYTAKIGNDILKEQKIVNSMKSALEAEEFVLYIQPKYELIENTIEGGEVLIRWIHPEKGMISPGEFIPVFEQNGFIMELDYYIWEKCCKLIRKWLDEGKKPYPVSTNISRVSLYNPKLVDQIDSLVRKYDIPPSLLQLELTESAYTTNPTAIKEAMVRLQKLGFTILMDDFGSGYSSLNVLKDIAVDILKIDMKFMSQCDMPGRSENILASVVRMAKWLNMPVVAEGVELVEQVSFLRSVGCEYVQGYYFAKPMTIESYEELAFGDGVFRKKEDSGAGIDADSLWDSKSQMEMLFSNMLQAVAVYEFDEATIDVIRVNNAYYDLFGFRNLAEYKDTLFDNIDDQTKADVLRAFRVVEETESVTECEFLRHLSPGKDIWVSMKLKFISKIGNKTVIFGMLSDITLQKEVDLELQKYRTALSALSKGVQTILVVDDVEVNRVALQSIFQESYNILQAENGEAALEVLKEHHYDVDLILLDLMMPVMDGPTFLKHKNASLDMKGIPVVIITSDDSPEQQVNTLSMGANDYVVKPFIPEIVIRRVCNVLESTKRFGEVLKGYNAELDAAQRDQVTGLYNRGTAEKLMQRALSQRGSKQAMLLVDIDNFKTINDTYGHPAGDRAIRIFAASLRAFFRRGDIIARYGGDEFIVLVVNIPSKEFVQKRCQEMIDQIRPVTSEGVKLECSIGVAISEAGDDTTNTLELIKKADKALYRAKEIGKNQCVFYGDIEAE